MPIWFPAIVLFAMTLMFAWLADTVLPELIKQKDEEGYPVRMEKTLIYVSKVASYFTGGMFWLFLLSWILI